MSLTFVLLDACWAQDTTFGVELEFMKRHWQSLRTDEPSPDMIKMRQEYVRLVKKQCKVSGCRVMNADDPIHQNPVVEYENWKFEITFDPGVIELRADPLTLEQYKAMASRIERDIYQPMRSLGLRPLPQSFGVNHIHIGLKSSGLLENPLLLRNVIVDFFNHSELAEGVLEYDTLNAPSVGELREKSKKILKEAVANFDRSKMSLQDAMELINGIKHAYSYGPMGVAGQKYQAINLSHIGRDSESATLEFRAMRAFESFDGFILMATLFERRIQFLRSFDRPIALGPMKPIRTRAEKVRRFYTYVTEAGLDWDSYKDLMPRDYRNISCRLMFK